MGSGAGKSQGWGVRKRNVIKLSVSFISITSLLCVLHPISAAQSSTIQWQGYNWHVKSGAAMGPGPCDWSSSNVWVDGKGFLHMKISQVNGKWSCSEIWTDKPLHFGTYQCQVEGRIDQLDPNIIFSMFSYQGPDEVKEIDIEYAKWGNPKEKNAWWTVYPNDKQGKKTYQGFELKLDGTFTTSRYEWSKAGVHYWMLIGHQPLTSVKNLIQEWDDRPMAPEHSITQSPMPLHFNLWLFQGKAPMDGKPVEVVIRSFEKR